MARLGAVSDDVLDVIDLGLGGMPIGRIYEGRERYTLIARFGQDFRADEEGLRRLPVTTMLGTVPLGAVADVTRGPGAAMLVDEGGKLATYIYVDPGERDLGGYVEEARTKVASLDLPDDLPVVWTGQYEFGPQPVHLRDDAGVAGALDPLADAAAQEGHAGRHACPLAGGVNMPGRHL